MTLPKFLVAKYAPDLRRMEPRNFGVIAWSPESVSMRFWGERRDSPTRPPSFVRKEDRDAYRQWVEYWRLMIAPTADGRTSRLGVNLRSPEFLPAMLRTGKPQFFLAEAGSMMIAVDRSEFHDMTDELYDVLVGESETQVDEQSASLQRATHKVIRKSGLIRAADFQQHYSFACRIVKEHEKALTFDYALGPTEAPKVLFQRVAIQNARSLQSALFMFEHVKTSSMSLSKAARCAFVYGADSVTAEAAADLRLLKHYTNAVIDVADVDKATDEVSRLLAI